MQLITKFNKGFKFLLCVIDIFSKYSWDVPLKDKKGVIIVSEFQKILDDSTELHSMRKSNKICVGKGSEFYNISFKIWLKHNNIEMYLKHKEGKSVVAKRFIRTLKTKIYKYMTSISKNLHINKLDDIVNEYNNTYHRATKMKPAEVKDNAYIDSSKEVNDKDPKYKVGDYVRISKYKNIFAKRYTPNWSEEVFVIKKVKNTVLWMTLLMTLKMKKLLEHFMKKNYRRLTNKNLGWKK